MSGSRQTLSTIAVGYERLLIALVVGFITAQGGFAQNAGTSKLNDQNAATQPDPPPKEDSPKTDAPKTEPSDEAPLPKKEELLKNLPSKADLLTKPPFDWIVLQKSDEVLIVKPVQPRPRTLQILKDKREEFLKPPTLKRLPNESADQFRERSKQAFDEARKQREKFESIEVELPDSTKVSEEQDDSSYRLNVEKLVHEIIYHEDLMLKRVDLLLEARELEDAYELLLALDRRHPGWPGYDERLNRFLLIDAQSKFARGDTEPAFVLLEQMHKRVKAAINSMDKSLRYQTMGIDLAKCQAELGKVIDALIEPAVKARDFRQARYHLARLLRLEPEHPNAAAWKERLTAETNQLLGEAAQASAAGQHQRAMNLAEQAALVWPATPSLKNAHRQFCSRWPTLKVGVPLVVPASFPFATEADRRRERLTRLPLFEPARIDGGARYRSRFLESWEPTDLGRQAVFTLRSSRSTWESSPIVTASAAVSALLERLQPESPRYDERLASFIDGIAVRGPSEFSVRFSRIPVRTEALFNFPLGTDEVSSQELDQRFRVLSQEGRTTTLRRTYLEPDKVLQRHVAEIDEIAYDSPEKAVQGLLRGEVSMLPNAPVWQLDKLTKDGRFFVRKYAVPQTHLIQFHPQSRPLRSAELRRAMLYSLDRSQVLREIVLRDLTVRTLREPLKKANVPAKLPPDTGLTYDEPKAELVWNGLSITDAESRQFTQLSNDAEYRKALQSLFKKSQPDRGHVVTAPYATNLSAYGPLVSPREADAALAFALATAARKGLGGQLPTLRMICEPEPVAQAAAKRLIEEWKRIIKVELITLAVVQPAERPRDAVELIPADRLPAASGQDVVTAPGAANEKTQPAQNDAPWDLAYRTVRMTEPMMELWPLLSLDTVASVQSVRYLPDWLRQGLIDLDRTADWTTTVQTLHELHRQLADTVQLIPLWEVDDALVFRKTIRGIPDLPLHPYQDLEFWISEPWYPTD